MASSISTAWKLYRQRKTRKGIAIDFAVLAVVLLLLIPSARMAIMVNAIRATLRPPKLFTENAYFFLPKNLPLQTASGERFIFDTLPKRPILINIGAVWSAQSRAEIKSLDSFRERYRDTVDVFFVTSEEVEETERYFTARNYTVPRVYYNAELDGTRTWGMFDEMMQSVPTSIMLSAEGKILVRKFGAARWKGRQMDGVMRKIIADMR